MNVLFVLSSGNGLGDNLALTAYIKDLKQQYKNFNLYYKCLTNCHNQIFYNNPNILPYNGQIINKKILHCWQNFCKPRYQFITNNKYNFLSVLYKTYNQMLCINVVQKTYFIDVYLSDEEKKNKIDTNKKVCVFTTAHRLYGAKQIKYWGSKNYQQLINKLKQQYCFVQIGVDDPYHINVQLQNTITLTNKTNIRDVFSIMYNADVIITGIVGLYHCANIVSNKFRKIICIGGSRQTQNYTNCYNIYNTKNYWLGYNYEKYKSCFRDNDICCWCDGGSSNDSNQKKGYLCKKLIYQPQYNDFIAQCIKNITVENIVNIIREKI